MADEIDPDLVSRVMREMGRRGGTVGGSKGGSAKVPKGFAKLTPEQRVAAAKRSAEVRRAKSAKSKASDDAATVD